MDVARVALQCQQEMQKIEKRVTIGYEEQVNHIGTRL